MLLIVKMKMTLYLCGLPPKTHNPCLIMRKNIRQIQLRGILQNILAVLFKTGKVIKNRKILRNHHSQEEPKETCQLIVMWFSEWDPGKEKIAFR